ncbi:hypothetical protein VTO42DRAFT_2538 [Malbranchea cinnamomea]
MHGLRLGSGPLANRHQPKHVKEVGLVHKGEALFGSEVSSSYVRMMSFIKDDVKYEVIDIASPQPRLTYCHFRVE